MFGAHLQAAVLAALTGYLLDVRSVRREIDRRETEGQFVVGRGAEGHSIFAVRSEDERAAHAAAQSDEV